LPALFVVGPGANLGIFLRRSLRLALSHTIKRLVAYRHYNKDQKCKLQLVNQPNQGTYRISSTQCYLISSLIVSRAELTENCPV